ncbi:hypothetical protein ZWY2020_012005 [Hordeum vulgare]|nr:hypothetical protein ZWY2020_012005 [Hordeum vulgare]
MAALPRRDTDKRARTSVTVDAELRLGRPDSRESKYVKVSVDGAQYQRKIDLRAFGGYAELRAALLGMAGQMLDLGVAYEDHEGNIMLAGDLPWDLFLADCKSVRIMRRSTMMHGDEQLH